MGASYFFVIGAFRVAIPASLGIHLRRQLMLGYDSGYEIEEVFVP